MANEAAKERLAELVETVQAGMNSIARMQFERAQLTESASAAGRRITVVVNADGVVVDTRLGPGVDELTPDEMAAAFTEAARTAQLRMRRRTKEMVESVRADNARLPRLSDIMPGIPDVQDMLRPPPDASTAPPEQRWHTDGSRRQVPGDRYDDGWSQRGSGVAESGW